MFTNRPSSDVSFKLRLLVVVMLSFSNLFLLIALISDHWINTRGDFSYLGLWKGCGDTICYSQTGLGYSKGALITCFIFSVVVNVITGLHYKYDFSDISNFKRIVGRVMLVVGLFEIYGMTHATIHMVLFYYFVSVSWALVLGWIATVLAVIAGGVSYYHGRIEPEITIPPPDFTTKTDTDPAPAISTIDPPPYSVSVS
ncbi:hypothetical protein GDO86_012200 [Hymenochirus boettgeri]|uniref:Uncharacterized protein n=1 Tax=Hymenochirus boettgeri TaxID=247094 RepID=A0A8T2IQA8_9PIPI|nr:hypothetical protein GDO86_012200 [Hymenochirus boettgeri]